MGMPQTVFTTSLASNVTLGNSVDLGHSWRFVNLEIPTAASGDFQVYGSSDNSIFRPIHSVSSVTAFNIPSACTQRIVEVPAGGIRYLKVRNTSGCTDVTTVYKFIVGD